MKNIFTFLILLLTLMSKDALSQKNKFGLTAGVNTTSGIASYYINAIESTTRHSGRGYSMGLFAVIPLNPQLYFQPSISFVNKKYSYESESYEYHMDANVLELNLNNMLCPFKNNRFSIGIGPSFAIGKLTISDLFKTTSNDLFNIFLPVIETLNIGNPIYKSTNNFFFFDIGVNTLVKYEFNNRFAITGNYNLSIQPIEKAQYVGCHIQYRFK